MSIRTYVVDDSAVVRQALMHMLQGDPEIELVGSAPNPLLAEPAIAKLKPDVLLLDIEMPGMDGITFLRKLMGTMPIPTVICSTLTTEGSRAALDALAAGAVAVVAKPRMGLKQFLEESRRELIRTLKAAAQARPRTIVRSSAAGPTGAAGSTGARGGPGPAGGGGLAHAAGQGLGSGSAAASAGLHALSVNKPIAIGSSTGGTQAIEQVLTQMPSDAPGIAIVQHMPERFTAMYASRLDGLCAINVREARDGDRIERGVALIAPGGRHMQVRKQGGQYYVQVFAGPPVNRHCPAVDVMFKSMAECAGRDALGIILTGMGDDGARGLLAMHQAGARTIAQDEASCVVFGMPREAIKLGAADDIVSLDQIGSEILRFDRRG
jgi:two-component system chemotaxis response regulator CheB